MAPLCGLHPSVSATHCPHFPVRRADQSTQHSPLWVADLLRIAGPCNCQTDEICGCIAHSYRCRSRPGIAAAAERRGTVQHHKLAMDDGRRTIHHCYHAAAWHGKNQPSQAWSRCTHGPDRPILHRPGTHHHSLPVAQTNVERKPFFVCSHRRNVRGSSVGIAFVRQSNAIRDHRTVL